MFMCRKNRKAMMKLTTKKLKKVNKYLNKKIKCIETLLKTVCKAMKKFKEQWMKITFVIIAIVMTACGSTRVSVDKPASGTSTTITVTTNNPITTDVKPNIELKNTK